MHQLLVRRHKTPVTLLATAVALALSSPVCAQDAAAAQPAPSGQQATNLDAVTVTGYRQSLQKSLDEKRYSTEQVDAAIDRIQEKLLVGGLREVPTTRLGELAMRELKRMDKVAYVRFASVYRSFEDVDEFRRLIKDI